MSKQLVLVTGPAGYIGCQTMIALTEAGHDLVGSRQFRHEFPARTHSSGTDAWLTKGIVPTSGTVLATFSLLRAAACVLALIGVLAALLPGSARAAEFCPVASNVVFDSDFAGDWITKFSAGEFAPSFVGGSRWEQIPVGEETWLRIHYENGTAGSESGMFFAHRLEPADAYTVEMTFRLKPGFLYNETGKLITGLRGGVVTPGKKPNGRDGFSVRTTWEKHGNAVAYIYHPDQFMWGGYGDTYPFGAIPSDRVHTIRQELVLNAAGQHNGSVRFWLNGALAFEKLDLRFRDIASLKIDRLTLDTFFGGSAANQGPLRDEYIDFGRVRVCKLN